MRIVIDTCVLYPTVMREMVLGAAGEGVFEPVWSARILEEWARAARKIGPTGEAQARSEIALTEAAFPRALTPLRDGIEARLWLPDSNDIHVLSTAVTSSADAILTLNKKDFPLHILREEGLQRLEPDGFLYGVWQERPDLMQRIGQKVLAEARHLSGQDWQIRALLKKARLPRLGKALSQA